MVIWIFLASLQPSKLLNAHFVVLSVFAGVTPLDGAATCSFVIYAANRVELELPAAVPAEVWVVFAQCTVVVGVVEVGVAVVTLASALGQPVHSHSHRDLGRYSKIDMPFLFNHDY